MESPDAIGRMWTAIQTFHFALVFPYRPPLSRMSTTSVG